MDYQLIAESLIRLQRIINEAENLALQALGSRGPIVSSYDDQIRDRIAEIVKILDILEKEAGNNEL